MSMEDTTIDELICDVQDVLNVECCIATQTGSSVHKTLNTCKLTRDMLNTVQVSLCSCVYACIWGEGGSPTVSEYLGENKLIFSSFVLIIHLQ